MQYKHDGRTVKAPTRRKAIAKLTGKLPLRDWVRNPELAEEFRGKLKGVFGRMYNPPTNKKTRAQKRKEARGK